MGARTLDWPGSCLSASCHMTGQGSVMPESYHQAQQKYGFGPWSEKECSDLEISNPVLLGSGEHGGQNAHVSSEKQRAATSLISVVLQTLHQNASAPVIAMEWNVRL